MFRKQAEADITTPKDLLLPHQKWRARVLRSLAGEATASMYVARVKTL